MTTRRGFLGAMLAAAAAPAIIRPASLMPIYIPKPRILTLWGDGIHDDTAALQALIDGERVIGLDGRPMAGMLAGGVYRLTDTLVFDPGTSVVMLDTHFLAQEIPEGRPALHFGDGGRNTLIGPRVELRGRLA
jgi:hypothetical protein